MDPRIYIAVSVVIILVAILVYLKWSSSKEELEEDMLPDDSDVDLVDDEEEFTIIDNQ